MPEKKQIESLTTPELMSIENQLLKCAKSGKPVLLYGDDTIGREELICKIHKQNGGIDAEVEYFFFKDKPSTIKEFENMYKKLRENDNPYDVSYQMDLDELKRRCSQSTKRTFHYIDSATMDGNEIYERLVTDTEKLPQNKEISQKKKKKE